MNRLMLLLFLPLVLFASTALAEDKIGVDLMNDSGATRVVKVSIYSSPGGSDYMEETLGDTRQTRFAIPSGPKTESELTFEIRNDRSEILSHVYVTCSEGKCQPTQVGEGVQYYVVEGGKSFALHLVKDDVPTKQ
ncbi:hypothetical protein [Pseudodesulfovibrio sp.]|uniref:hypothetical protein n=1 Tax=unclassified Pseudodesulfovibrio TaxID=2661612 RepID=UPI003B005017